MMQETYYTWKEFDQDILLLVSQMQGWMPDYVVGIKRGGLIPAIKLSHILDKPLLILSCQLRDGKDNCIKFLEEIPKDKKLLIVDDICDSGETFERINQELKDYKEIKFCALFNNIRQKFLTDYKAKKIDREENKKWIIFPWEL